MLIMYYHPGMEYTYQSRKSEKLINIHQNAKSLRRKSLTPLQKQPTEVLYKNCLEKFRNIQSKTHVLEIFKNLYFEDIREQLLLPLKVFC